MNRRYYAAASAYLDRTQNYTVPHYIIGDALEILYLVFFLIIVLYTSVRIILYGPKRPMPQARA